MNFFGVLTKREKVLFYLTAIFLFSIIIEKGVFSPLRKKSSYLSKKIISYEVKLIKAKRILQEEERIESAYKKIVNSNHSDTSVSFLKEIETITKKIGLHITEIRYQKVQESNIEKRYFVILKGKDKWEKILRFIYEIEKASLLLRIERLQLVSQKNEELRIEMVLSKLQSKF